MRKSMLIATLVVALPFASEAQDGFKMGAELGVNFATMASNELIAGGKVGFHVGGIANYGFGDEGKFSILASPQFSIMGAKNVSPDAFGGSGFNVGTADVSLNYIDIPIMFRYRFSFGVYSEVGFYLGIGAGRSVSMAGATDSTTAAFKNSFKGGDFGYAAGIGYIHPSGFGIGFRYVLGLSDIYDPPASEDPNDAFLLVGGTTLNVGVQFSAMYFFQWDGGGGGHGRGGHGHVLRRHR